MHALGPRLLTTMTRRKTAPRHQATLSPKTQPRLVPRQNKAFHYFDASQHSALSLRLLLGQLAQQHETAHSSKTQAYLCLSMKNLLESIRPGLDDDDESKQYFFSLLRMHLSYLSSAEVHQLSDALKISAFTCHVTESIIDDEVYRDYGFSNGPPHSFNRTLMQTQDFFDLLDELKNKDAGLPFQRLPLKSESATMVRNVLSDCSAQWMQSRKTPEALYASACLLAKALNRNKSHDGVCDTASAGH